MVTVAIPAYKAQFLSFAIKSVLSQGYKDFELVIVNDASPEGIREIVEQFNDPRVRYFENPRNVSGKSPVKNWNICLQYAQGEFFTLLGDDDFFEDTFLQEMISCASHFPNVGIFHSRVRKIDEDGKTITYSPAGPEWESGIDFIWHRMKNVRLLYVSGFFCRTEFLRKNGGFVNLPLAWASDEATWFLLASKSGISYVNKPLCNIRESSLNISSVGRAETKIRAIDSFEQWFRTFLVDLRSQGSFENEIVSEIGAIYKKRMDDLKCDAIVAEARQHSIQWMWIAMQWLPLRQKSSLSFRVFIKAFLYSLKLHPYA